MPSASANPPLVASLQWLAHHVAMPRSFMPPSWATRRRPSIRKAAATASPRARPQLTHPAARFKNSTESPTHRPHRAGGRARTCLRAMRGAPYACSRVRPAPSCPRQCTRRLRQSVCDMHQPALRKSRYLVSEADERTRGARGEARTSCLGGSARRASATARPRDRVARARGGACPGIGAPPAGTSCNWSRPPPSASPTSGRAQQRPATHRARAPAAICGCAVHQPANERTRGRLAPARHAPSCPTAAREHALTSAPCTTL